MSIAWLVTVIVVVALIAGFFLTYLIVYLTGD